MGYKLYSPNEGHTCDYGVDFLNGAGFTSSAIVSAIFVGKGYTAVEATALSEFDKLPTATLIAIAAEFSVTIEEDATKAEIVAALIADRAALVTSSEDFTDVVADIREVLDNETIVTQAALNAAVGALIAPFEEGGGA